MVVGGIASVINDLYQICIFKVYLSYLKFYENQIKGIARRKADF